MRKSTKEEAEKKEIPPSPPIGRKGEEEKAHSLAHAGACACAREDAWIGRVCRALGGQKASLDFGQRQMVDIIRTDSGWMDENIDKKRKHWREKKQRERSAKKAKSQSTSCPEDNGDNEVSDTIHPSFLPSFRGY